MKVYWLDTLTETRCVCGFHVWVDDGLTRIAYTNKLKAGYRRHVRAAHPEREAELAWSRTSSADLSSGAPERGGETVEPVKPTRVRTQPDRHSRHPSTQAVRASAARAQARRDEWLRAINTSTPRRK